MSRSRIKISNKLRWKKAFFFQYSLFIYYLSLAEICFVGWTLNTFCEFSVLLHIKWDWIIVNAMRCELFNLVEEGGGFSCALSILVALSTWFGLSLRMRDFLNGGYCSHLELAPGCPDEILCVWISDSYPPLMWQQLLSNGSCLEGITGSAVKSRFTSSTLATVGWEEVGYLCYPLQIENWALAGQLFSGHCVARVSQQNIWFKGHWKSAPQLWQDLFKVSCQELSRTLVR